MLASSEYEGRIYFFFFIPESITAIVIISAPNIFSLLNSSFRNRKLKVIANTVLVNAMSSNPAISFTFCTPCIRQ